MTSPRFTGLFAGILLTAMTACSTIAPKYTPAPEHVNALRDAGMEPLKLGDFTTDAKGGKDVNQLSIRGGAYVSPFEGSFVRYLREALRQELDDARLLDEHAAVELSGVLIRNELNAAGVSTANAVIEARFVVKRGGEVRYDKVKSATYEWESSFMGNVAIPRAQQNYPTVVQKLLKGLYVDPEFIAATKK